MNKHPLSKTQAKMQFTALYSTLTHCKTHPPTIMQWAKESPTEEPTKHSQQDSEGVAPQVNCTILAIGK